MHEARHGARVATASGAGAAPQGWRAHLALGFEPRGERTVLAHRRHLGPLVVQRPFYPEGGVCHTYVLHPPGGIVGGDRLGIDVRVARDAHALITTPAAGKLYRSGGAGAEQRQSLSVAEGAVLEWLPQESIAFDGARAVLATRVDLAQGARFLGWEILCLGRPSAGEAFRNGSLVQTIELWQAGEPRLVERMGVEGADRALHAPWGLAGRAVSGTLIATPAGPEALAAVREACAGAGEGLFGATLLEGMLVARALDMQAEAVRARFVRAWEVLRPLLAGRPACAPRIWAT